MKMKIEKILLNYFPSVIQRLFKTHIKKNQKIVAISFKNLAGMFGFSPYEGIRLGKEIAELVRFFGIGGVFILMNYQIMVLNKQT